MKYCNVLHEQHHVRLAYLFLNELTWVSIEKFGKNHPITIELSIMTWRSLWLMHFYGRKGYREDLRQAVQRLLRLLPKTYRTLGPTHRLSGMVEDTLRCALTEQLDWSLDDLELSVSEKLCLEFFLEHRLHRL